MTTARNIMTAIMKAPIVLYRYTISAFAGRECRYLPTCSEYAQEAIERHGPWKGLWLTLARLCRCNPWGPSGLDPVPDMQNEEHPWWAPWRYGRWSGRHMAADLDNER